MPESDEEIAFYRAVEDFFAAARGVPHVLSPKDFQLLRSWWQDRVPLAAVVSGITEVLARRRERGEDEPVVSLSYCRHAVRRHSRRLAEMHLGEPPPDSPPGPSHPAEAVRELAGRLRRAPDGWRQRQPEVAAVVEQIAQQIESAPAMPPALLEEHLYAIETVLLDRCWRALAGPDRDAIEGLSRQAADRTDAGDDARERTRRAVRDREVRLLLGLPRLELP